jgi:hypothetical protein
LVFRCLHGYIAVALLLLYAPSRLARRLLGLTVKTHRLGLLATAISLSAASWAGAQTVFNWDPPAHANVFSTPTNWTPAGPPGTTGEARFNEGNCTYVVDFSTDPTNARRRVGDDHATFDLNGRMYPLTSTSTSNPLVMAAGSTFVDDALLMITHATCTLSKRATGSISAA